MCGIMKNNRFFVFFLLGTILTPDTMIYDLYMYLTNLPRWHVFAIVMVGYLFYYLIEVVKVSHLFNL